MVFERFSRIILSSVSRPFSLAVLSFIILAGGNTAYGSSSSHGRKIAGAAAPGPPATPTAIYHINDENGVAIIGAGHSGAVIPKKFGGGVGCCYYSYGMDGAVTLQDYNNIGDALTQAKAADYTREQHWACTGADADLAKAAAWAYNSTPYQGGHVCWTMVYDALNAAGTSAMNYGDGPNYNYNRNRPLADGNSRL